MTLRRPEGERVFHVYIPRSFNPSVRTPLIFAFHGFTNSCNDFLPDASGTCRTNQCQMSVQAERHGFLLVSPCGWTSTASWNAGTCCGLHANDDVQFTRDMVAAISARLCVDPDRIFSTGFSNGAMMSNRLACEARDLIRGVAAVAGPVVLRPGNAAGLQLCDEAWNRRGGRRMMDFLAIHGTVDLVVPYGGNGALGFPDIRENFNRWARRSGCTGTSRQTLNRGAMSNQIFTSCGSASNVEIVTWAAGGHSWPRVTSNPTNFDSAEYLVSFFRRQSAPWPAVAKNATFFIPEDIDPTLAVEAPLQLINATQAFLQ